MSMRPAILPLLAAALLIPTQASAQSASTTRIETRPFYGATVTLEEGVRVFRPLPAHRRVIINPGGQTPLNLGFEENHSVSRNYNHGPAAAASSSSSSSSGPANTLGGFSVDRGRGHHRGGRNGGFGGRGRH